MLDTIDADRMYDLTKQIKALEAELDSLKQQAVDQFKATGSCEVMGTRGKVVVTTRSTTTYSPLEVYRLCGKKIAQFLPLVKIQNTALTKAFDPADLKACVEEVKTSYTVSIK